MKWRTAAALVLAAGGAVTAGPEDGATQRGVDEAQTTQVEVQVTEGSSGEVFGQISKQTGMKFTNSPERLSDLPATRKTVTVAIKGKPFWVAMREAGEATGAYPAIQYTRSDGMMLVPRDELWGRRPICETDQLTAVVNSVTRMHQIRTDDPKFSLDGVTVDMRILLDPRLAPGGDAISWTFRLKTAEDENGVSLVPAPGQVGLPFATGWAFQGGFGLVTDGKVVLSRPEKSGEKIRVLEGIERIRCGRKFETLEVADVLAAKPVGKTVGAVTYTFKKATKVAGGAEVELGLEFAPGADVQTGFNLPPQGWLRLTDDAGHVWKSAGSSIVPAARPEAGKAEEHLVRYKWTAEGTATPAKFSLRVPQEFEDVVVPVVFRDLPLP